MLLSEVFRTVNLSLIKLFDSFCVSQQVLGFTTDHPFCWVYLRRECVHVTTFVFFFLDKE